MMRSACRDHYSRTKSSSQAVHNSTRRTADHITMNPSSHVVITFDKNQSLCNGILAKHSLLIAIEKSALATRVPHTKVIFQAYYPSLGFYLTLETSCIYKFEI